jgi:hypothetical protein
MFKKFKLTLSSLKFFLEFKLIEIDNGVEIFDKAICSNSSKIIKIKWLVTRE